MVIREFAAALQTSFTCKICLLVVDREAGVVPSKLGVGDGE
jgi:hypothetical protein